MKATETNMSFSLYLYVVNENKIVKMHADYLYS